MGAGEGDWFKEGSGEREREREREREIEREREERERALGIMVECTIKQIPGNTSSYYQ